MKVFISWVKVEEVQSAVMELPSSLSAWEIVKEARNSLPVDTVDCELTFHAPLFSFTDAPNHSVSVYQLNADGQTVCLGYCWIPLKEKDPCKFVKRNFKEHLKNGPLLCPEYGGFVVEAPIPATRLSSVTFSKSGESNPPVIVKTANVTSYIASMAAKFIDGACRIIHTPEDPAVYTLEDADGKVVWTWHVEEIKVPKSVSAPSTKCWSCANACPSADGSRGCSWSRNLEPVDGWSTLTLNDDVTTTVIECPEFVEG